jgi:hypothetical protein
MGLCDYLLLTIIASLALAIVVVTVQDIKEANK